ncbi:MAG: prepilin-type N-terminal cleavage/methylation domain-containing protein [Bdellovibrionaceae bacterium]|nr:prepilin-type N-terminal cleavage/methylation domain-containing protein [Pseudobdellovibrionaceae bacterium]
MNSRGFSFVEMLIYVAMSLVTMLAAYLILMNNTQNYVGTIERVDMEQELLRVESQLKRLIQQGLNVRSGTSASPGPEGWIATYNSVGTTTLATWGVFQRESQNRRVGSVDSRIRNTGLFFMPPTVSGGVEKEGVLFIDQDADADGRVQASYGNSYTGNMVSLRVYNPRVTGTIPSVQRLLSIDVELRVRYFPANHPKATRCFRPTGCSADSRGREESRSFTVLLRNNDLGPNPFNPALRETALGKIYFFPDFILGD